MKSAVRSRRPVLRGLVLLMVALFALAAAASPALHTHLAGDSPSHCIACAGSPTVTQAPTIAAATAQLLPDAGAVVERALDPVDVASSIRLPGRSPPAAA